MAMVIAGNTIFNALGVPTPELVKKLQESPWLHGFLVFMIGNSIQSSLLQTGAFEIYVDGTLVFSKLQTGRMPSFEEIVHKLAEFDIIINQ